MKRLVLPLILVLAFILRVIWLDKYPTGFTPDETSFGYDAYSILKTGSDQWGHKFPLVLESFGDFKSPLYVYLTIPSVAIFGLTKEAVRLPNAVLGTLAVWVTYLLARKLFNKKVGLFSAMLLAISPWHIMLSRGAFEANLTTFFLPFGLWLFLEKRYVASGLILGLNLFSYHSAKLVTPLVLAALIFYTHDNVKKYWPAVAIFGIFLILTLYTFFLGAGARVEERSITAGAGEAAFDERVHSSGLIHNKYTVVMKRFFENYFTYLSPQFLFTQGPKEGTYGMIPGRGVLFWFTIPLLIVGIRKKPYFLLVWILLSPIPASLATGVGFSANRVATMMPAIDILLAVGALAFFDWLSRRKILLITYYLIIIGSLALFIEDYFIQSLYKIARDMLYGNLEAAQWVNQNVAIERKVIVSKSLSEPHIYFAFTSGFDPSRYREETRNWRYKTWVDQIPTYNLGRFTFTNIKDHKGNAILVGKPEEFPQNITPLKIIFYPDGKPSIYIVDSGQSYANKN